VQRPTSQLVALVALVRRRRMTAVARLADAGVAGASPPRARARTDAVALFHLM
jgi:hypothetical protein